MHKSRKRAKRCGKVVMYIGFIMMILDLFGIGNFILSIFGLDMFPDREEKEIFTDANLKTLGLIDAFRMCLDFAQGYFMVMATKQAIKGLSTSELNPRAVVNKVGDEVS